MMRELFVRRRIPLLTAFFVVLHCLCPCTGLRLHAQVNFTYSGDDDTYILVERSDFRRYDNGRYTGLTSREVRSYVYPISPPENAASALKAEKWFSGNFMVYEATNRNAVQAAQGVDAIMPATFHIADNGKLTVVPVVEQNTLGRGRGAKLRDTGFPSYRGIPTFPSAPVSPGQSWAAAAERSVDPLNIGTFTRLQLMVQYTYVGEEVYKGVPVHHVTAKWATRYGSGTSYRDYDGDEHLSKATGTHNADIMVSKETGAAILIRDNLDETFVYDTGNSVQFKGVTLLFTEFPPTIDRTKAIPALNRIASLSGGLGDGSGSQGKVSGSSGGGSASKSGSALSGRSGTGSVSALGADTGASGTKNNMVVEETDAGLRLSIRELQFAPDSAELLPGEKGRLDMIASALLECGTGQFLVEGHSASTGNPGGEKTLSVARAKRIVDELVKRGIAAERFFYIGHGSDRPIADNATSEGRAKNRRVEITILE